MSTLSIGSSGRNLVVVMFKPDVIIIALLTWQRYRSVKRDVIRLTFEESRTLLLPRGVLHRTSHGPRRMQLESIHASRVLAVIPVAVPQFCRGRFTEEAGASREPTSKHRHTLALV